MDDGTGEFEAVELDLPEPIHTCSASDGGSPELDVELLRQEGAETLRGELFRDLDRLGVALEIEAAEALDRGDEAEAIRIEDRRLGVRLAQRLVSGVHADEVDPRLERVHDLYERLMA